MRKHLNGLAILGAARVGMSVGEARLAAQGRCERHSRPIRFPSTTLFRRPRRRKIRRRRSRISTILSRSFRIRRLMQYVYELYYQAYFKAKNYAKSLEYADKLIAMGDKAEFPRRFAAIQARVQLFGSSSTLAERDADDS